MAALTTNATPWPTADRDGSALNFLGVRENSDAAVPRKSQSAQIETIFQPSMLGTSTLTPGPMVELRLARFRYVPLAPDGLALLIASQKALTLATSWSAAKLALPTPACTVPAFSTRHCTCPRRAASTGARTLGVAVPSFGFG